MTKTLREGADSADRESTRTASSAVSHAEHTPLPWELLTLNGRVPAVREIRRPFGEASCYESSVRSASGEHVCKLDFGYGRKCDEANAAFIVRACNHHEALLAALKEAVDEVGRFGHGSIARRLRTAIANAEGK